MVNYLFTKTPLLFLTQSLWRDEAFSYLLAKNGLTQIIRLTANDFNPPLYYFILHFWIKLLGRSEIALRSLSFLFYWATVYVVYLFLTKIIKLKSKKSLPYILLVTINPVLLYYAFEARMYTQLAFFVTLSYYSYWLKKNRLYFISTLASLFTHYFAIAVVFSQLFTSLWGKKHSKKGPILCLVLFVPWMIYVFSLHILVKEPFWIINSKPTFYNILIIILNFPATIYLGHIRDSLFLNYLKANTFFSLLLYLSLIFTYLKTALKRDREMFFYLFFWAIVIPAVVGIFSIWKPLYLSRYLIFSSVGFLILLIFGLEKIKPLSRYLAIAVIFIFTVRYDFAQTKYLQKTNMAKSIKEIKAISGKKDLIYVTDVLDFFVAQYYFDENRVLIYENQYEQIPNFVGKVLIPKEKITSLLPTYPVRAFMIKDNGSYTIQAVY
ncbi:hypothetical protein GYA28_04640 [Candidatus Roizmanbacteria bacterium]|nr:hypothetical protein [Candidatus Roizmanbacteria bacterium]